jgi:hypothetical protein
MPLARDIGRKHADLAVGDLAGRARVLACHAAGGLALLQEAGLVHHQHGLRLGQGLDHVVAHQIAKRIRVPLCPTE